MLRPTKHIASENPYEKMWDTFVFFESESMTKTFLQKHYEMKTDHPKRCAYDNAMKFIYFIKQAREYYNTAADSHVLVKPLLLYYGMMTLMKAVILKHDPFYPANTSVLRHGMTTRKLKKLNYNFNEDEVKIQKEGLLPHFARLVYGPQFRDQPKYKLLDLMSLLPELHETSERLYNNKLIYPISTETLSNNEDILLLSDSILDYFHISTSNIEDYLNRSLTGDIKLEVLHGYRPGSLCIKRNDAAIEAHPRFVDDYKGKLHFLLHAEELLTIPESCTHFIVMYQLGMLCRYETELWGELIYSFQSEDTYIINEFINLSMRKFPNLILNLLFEENIIFDHH